MSVPFSSLNALCASMRRNPQYSSYKLCFHSSRIACILPSIPDLRPLQSYSILQASLTSVPVTTKTHYSKQFRQFSPIQTSHTPICYFIPNNRPDIRAQYAAHGGWSFTNHSVIDAKIFQSSALASPKRRIQCYRLTAYILPGLYCQ